MPRPGRLVIAATLAWAVAAPAESAWAGSPSLTVLSTGPIAITASQGSDVGSGAVVVLNGGTTPVSVTGTIDASTASAVALDHLEPPLLQPGHATRVTFVVRGLKALTTSASGELVLSGDGSVAAVGVSMTPAPQPSRNWAHDIVVGALAAGAALFVLVAMTVTMIDGLGRLGEPAPGPQWSFSTSWASTITAAGAVFGVALGGVALPSVPREIDKQTLLGLNVLFGALIVAAPFVFQTLRNPRSDPFPDNERQGFNATLLLAASITFAGVLGELAALALLAWEVVAPPWRDAAVGVAIAAGVLATYYSAVTAFWLAHTRWPQAAPVQKVLGGTAEARTQRRPRLL